MILNDICEFIVDCPHTTAPDEGVGYPLIRTPNIGKGRLNLNGVHRVSEKVYRSRIQRGTPQDNDLIFAREAPAGNVAIVKNGEKVCLGQRTVLLRPNKSKACPDYLAYYILAPKQQYKLLGTANGATVAHVNLPIIRNMPVELPSLDVQERIAGYLSTYDDLIENNRKQIKLLEEAAQRLYKAWFVDLRFPGHEETPIVDGVPAGWHRCSLGEIDYTLESGSRPKGGIDASLINGVPSIGAENVIGLGKYNFNSEKLVTRDFFSKMKRGKLKNRDILIYKDGAYIGRTSLFQDEFPYAEASVNEHVFLLHTKEELLQYYLFFTLYQHEYYLKMQKLNRNAAQPGINQTAIASLPLLIPTKQLLSSFDRFTIPIMHRIFNLAKQNRNLELARDRLLPKLMSGEMEVLCCI